MFGGQTNLWGRVDGTPSKGIVYTAVQPGPAQLKGLFLRKSEMRVLQDYSFSQERTRKCRRSDRKWRGASADVRGSGCQRLGSPNDIYRAVGHDWKYLCDN